MSGPRQGPAQTAAGGVVWRGSGDGLEIALVHRPRYDDWSLPKGKLHPEEHPLLGAVREVEEETGALVAVGRRLTRTEYTLQGAVKRVSYWSMRYLGGEHTPSREVDRVEWLPPKVAADRLSYGLDRTVVADFLTAPVECRTLLLMRHAKAGKRAEWHGDDRLRPLDKIGRRQARDAVPVLAAFAPSTVLAADRVRCQQTVVPLAQQLGLELTVAPEFSDEAYLADRSAGRERARVLSEQYPVTLICSQGSAIPALLADFGLPERFPACRKSSVWVLSLEGNTLVAADYYGHPGT